MGTPAWKYPGIIAPGYFYVRNWVYKNPGKTTNNLAGAGENAYSRDAPTSLRHVYRTTGTILVSYICSKLRPNTKEFFNVHYGLGRQTPRVHRPER